MSSDGNEKGAAYIGSYDILWKLPNCYTYVTLTSRPQHDRNTPAQRPSASVSTVTPTQLVRQITVTHTQLVRNITVLSAVL
jgi:hypothetical protein